MSGVNLVMFRFTAFLAVVAAVTLVVAVVLHQWLSAAALFASAVSLTISASSIRRMSA